MVELIFAGEVEDDLGQAYAWYEKKRKGLGEEFLRCVDVCMKSICRNPEIYACVQSSYRRALVRRFPYAVFFESVGDTITIYVICHTAQDEAKWQERLP